MTDNFDPARLRELHEAATPGPWVSIGTDPAEGGDWFWVKAQPNPAMRGFTHEIGVMNGSQSDPVRQANAALIVALRNAAPTILAMADENAALKAEVARLRVAPVDAHEPAPTAVADSAAADSVVNGGAREIAQAAIAIAIAKAMGDNFSNAFKNKERWIAKRGMSGGRFRDINEPMQCDYLAAAQAALDTAAPLIRAQIADWLVEQPPHLSLQEYADAIERGEVPHAE